MPEEDNFPPRGQIAPSIWERRRMTGFPESPSGADESPARASSSREDVLGRRISAALIDLALLLGLFVVLALTIGERKVEGGSVSLSLSGAAAGLYFALVLLYYFALEAALGQTVGKLLLGLRVVDPDGSRPSVFAIGVRTLLRIVDWLPLLYLVGFITMMVTGSRRQRLGDLAAKTSLARAPPMRHRSLALVPVVLLLLSIVGLSVYRASASDEGGKSASPTGQAAVGTIAFTSDRGCPDANNERSEIFLMNADGSSQGNLTNSAAAEAGPAWSPDGRKIVYSRAPTNFPPYDLFVMNADGSGPRNLTKSRASDLAPAWSPDGRKIAWERDRTDVGPFDIFVMNADGSGQRNLTENSPGQNFDPDWSPDGTRIAYARSTGAEVSPEVFVMNAHGSGQTNLTNNSGADDSPDWSPDGKKIAFATDRTTDDAYEIFVMNSDGGDQTNLTRTPDEEDQSPSWSPDGTRIAFTRSADTLDVFVMNADGSGQTNLTNNPAADYNGDWRALPRPAPAPPPRACR
jgi:Tol biopolymer transport system component/uncharacterized RDD family membrane protein YckC